MVVTAERIATLLETAPVGAIARLSLHQDGPRHRAVRMVAEHVCKGLADDIDRDQLALPL